MYLIQNQFLLDSTHLYILHNVLLLTCSIAYLLFLLWIYGTLNKTTITIKITQYTSSVNGVSLPTDLPHGKVFTDAQ